MSEEQLSALLAKLKEDSGLRAQLLDAQSIDLALVIAADAGFAITADELQECSQLCDEELDAIVGGAAGICGAGRQVNMRCGILPSL